MADIDARRAPHEHPIGVIMGCYGNIGNGASRQEVCSPGGVPPGGHPILRDGLEGDWEYCAQLRGVVRLNVQGDVHHGGTIEEHQLCGVL